MINILKSNVPSIAQRIVLRILRSELKQKMIIVEIIK
jgi:hypothetical protein